MNCRSCGQGNPDGQKYCGACGARLGDAPGTPEGGIFFGPGAPRSYTPAHLTDRILTTRSALEGEHKRVTVLFCDIAGSTPLAARLGPERMHRVLNAFFDLCLQQVHRYEGTVNQFLGDGLMALFGAPLALEDHARRAVLAAVAIRDEIERHGAEIVGEAPGLRTRIGLSTGSVVVGKIGDNLRMDYTAVGDTTNVAARLQSEADPGSIYCTEAVAHAVAAYVECTSLGACTLKGKSEPVPVWRVVKTWPTRRQPGTGAPALVGRTEIVAQLRSDIDALAAGSGGILAIVGEAGMGKSRLLAEARDHAAELSLRWVEGAALSFGGTLSYWPFREAIRGCLEMSDDADEQRNWNRLLARMIDLLGRQQGEELAPYVGVLLALPIPEEFAARTRALDGLSMGHQIFRSTLKLFERLGQVRPVAIVFEDWHWADASSVDLLLHLLPLVANTPILFVVASRPELEGPLGVLARGVAADQRLASRFRELALAPLAPDDMTELAINLLGGGSLPRGTLRLLLRRSTGNPFFLSELVRTLITTQAIEKDVQTSTWAETGRLDATLLPDSVEGLILARIDRLEDESKQLLRVAAVIGRSFFYRVLQAVAEGFTALDADLARLVRSEFIDPKHSARELEYIFKHPLIQHATYRSLLEERRRVLHRRVGETIEQLFRDRLEEFHSILAYHFAQAEQWPKAQQYLLEAADHAGGMAADAEALELYQKALEVSEKSPEGRLSRAQRAELDCKIGEALYRSGKQEQGVEHLRQALGRLGVVFPRKRSEIRPATIKALLRTVPVLLLRHRPGRKLGTGEQPNPEQALQFRIFETLSFMDYFSEPPRMLLDLLLGFDAVESRPRSGAYVVAIGGLGLAFGQLGVRWLAKRCSARALGLAMETDDEVALGSCYLFLGVQQEQDGESGAAVESLRKSVDLYLAAGDLRRWKTALKALMMVLRNRGDRSWIGLNNQILQLFQEMQDPHSEAWAWTGRGYERMLDGNYAAAAEEFRRACNIYEQVPDYRTLAGSLCQLGRCHLHLGDVDEALMLVKRGAGLVTEHQMRGMNVTPALMTAADVTLLAAAKSSGERREQLLREAQVACDAATRHAKRTRDYGAADSIRMRGVLAWLRGEPLRAEALWREAIQVAERQGAKWVLAQTHLELGRRLDNSQDLLRARDLFGELGAEVQAAAIAEALDRDGARGRGFG